MRCPPVYLQPVAELLRRHEKLEWLAFWLRPRSQVANNAKRILLHCSERVVNRTLDLWQAVAIAHRDGFEHLLSFVAMLFWRVIEQLSMHFVKEFEQLQSEG